MGHLPARQSANCQRQTTYLTLVEMSVDQSPAGRSKRDDRLRLRPSSRSSRRAWCCVSEIVLPIRRNSLIISSAVRFTTVFREQGVPGSVVPISRTTWSSSSSRRRLRNMARRNAAPMGVLRRSEVGYDRSLGLIAKRLRYDGEHVAHERCLDVGSI